MMEAALVYSRTFAVVLAFGITCGRGGPGSPGQRTAATGQWSGPHIGMEVTGSGAEVEFDCAHGRIDEPLALDGSGRFDVPGTYTPEQPGPRREDETGQRVRYTGRVEGQTMTLRITAPGASLDLTFTLEHGRASNVRKCQ